MLRTFARLAPLRSASLFVIVNVALASAACGSLEASAAKDPMKCERDPKCAKHERTFDCSSQCADDPACVDRCREVQVTSGQSSAH
jgi:hypothetical protein